MKRLIMTSFALMGVTFAAAPKVSDLAALVANPKVFRPTSFYDDSKVNDRTIVNSWNWGVGPLPDIKLMKTKDGKGFRLSVFNDESYPYLKATSSLKKLFVLKDDLMDVTLTVYLIQGGKFKNTYLLTQRYSDGGSSYEVSNKVFQSISGKNSELQEGGNLKMLSYPVYAFLYTKSQFCRLDKVKC